MSTTTDQIREAVSRVLAVIEELKRADPDTWGNLDPTPGSPATASAIAAIEARVGRPLPPSYRSFLELHDGYTDLHITGPLLPAEPDDDAVEWIEDLADVLDNEDRGTGVIVGGCFDADDFVYLDPERPQAGGEWAVVTMDDFEETVYPDFAAYLRGRAEAFAGLAD